MISIVLMQFSSLPSKFIKKNEVQSLYISKRTSAVNTLVRSMTVMLERPVLTSVLPSYPSQKLYCTLNLYNNHRLLHTEPYISLRKLC